MLGLSRPRLITAINGPLWRQSVTHSGLLLLAMCLPSDVHGQQKSDKGIADIIDNVRSCESLYENMEVSTRESYVLSNENVMRRVDAAPSEKTHSRCVLQRGLVYTEKVSEMTGQDGAITKKLQRCGYDGEMTRLIDDNIVNIHQGRVDCPNVYRPHTWILPHIPVPLSVFLEGGRSLQQHAKAGMLKDRFVRTALEKEEEIEGVPCLKLRTEIRMQEQAEEINEIIYLWLAPTRNYLPMKSEGTVMYYSHTLPLEKGIAKDFREIRSGLWLPFEYSVMVYDERTIKLENKLVVSNATQGWIEKAELDPHYDVSFFRDIPMPASAAVYELKDGKITKSYTIGANKGLPRSGSRWRWLICGSLLVCLVAAWFSMRRLKASGKFGGLKIRLFR
jgi:hypothetical protein